MGRCDRPMRPYLATLCLLLAAAPRAETICTANASPAVACKIKVPKKPKVRITRDDYGVPHLKARSLYDVGYGIGQAQAQDRLFQMELVRKSATGNVAELFGPDFLSDDEDARRQFYADEELQYLVSSVSCPIQTLVQGFVDGVNAYVDAIYADATLANVPHEFFFVPTGIRLQGNGTIPSGVRYTVEVFGSTEVYKPDRWRTTDVAAIGVLLAGRFGSGGGRQLRQAALLNYLTAFFTAAGPPPGRTAAEAARDVFEDVRWLSDPKAPTTVPKTGAINPVNGGHTPVPIADGAPLAPPATRLAAALGLFLAPARALAAPTDRRAAQHEFVRGLDPRALLRGLK